MREREALNAKVAEAKATNDTLANYMLFDGIGSMFEYNSPHLAARWMRYDNYRYSRRAVFEQLMDLCVEDHLEEELKVMVGTGSSRRCECHLVPASGRG